MAAEGRSKALVDASPQVSTHYEKAPRFRESKLVWQPPLPVGIAFADVQRLSQRTIAPIHGKQALGETEEAEVIARPSRRSTPTQGEDEECESPEQ
jgi:hypothetical protein